MQVPYPSKIQIDCPYLWGCCISAITPGYNAARCCTWEEDQEEEDEDEEKKEDGKWVRGKGGVWMTIGAFFRRQGEDI